MDNSDLGRKARSALSEQRTDEQKWNDLKRGMATVSWFLAMFMLTAVFIRYFFF